MQETKSTRCHCGVGCAVIIARNDAGHPRYLKYRGAVRQFLYQTQMRVAA
jgi:hypothetical protein